MSEPYWRTKHLEDMSADEWEALCDGCGRCCLNKLEDWDTGEIYFTSVACKLLNSKSCRCKDYKNRAALVPDCVQLDAASVRSLTWLPATCAYRRVAEERDLEWWHPLVSGDPETVHSAGISVRGRIVSEDDVAVEDYEKFLASWPAQE